MQKQLEIMLQLQNKMNQKVHADWVEQNFAWFRAVWIECGELVDHFGYKWWKKQQPDMQQVQLEIIDIWHFGLSMLIDGRPIADIAAAIASQLNMVKTEQLGVIEATEALAQSVLSTKQFDVAIFWNLLLSADMNFDDLFKQYVGKNVLNFFRQDHGYKDGSYIKSWHGREDNEHLSDILASYSSFDDGIADDVYQRLAEVYKTVTA